MSYVGADLGTDKCESKLRPVEFRVPCSDIESYLACAVLLADGRVDRHLGRCYTPGS